MVASIPEIVAYWSDRENECDLSVDWAEARERCWRCGYKRKLERCHIVPRSLGGPDGAENLVLLCFQCHREAPNVTDRSFMWLWLRKHKAPFYDTYWTNRGIEEFEKLYKRKPFSSCSHEISNERISELMREYMRKTSHHFGEEILNPSTVAWIFAQIEKEIIALSGQSDAR
jgi:hypothetical protein